MHEGNEGKVERTCAVRPHQGADAMTGVLPVPQSFRTAPGRCIRSFGCAGQPQLPLEQRLNPRWFPAGMPEEGCGEAVLANGAGRTMQGRRNAAPALTGRQGARSGIAPERAEGTLVCGALCRSGHGPRGPAVPTAAFIPAGPSAAGCHPSPSPRAGRRRRRGGRGAGSAPRSSLRGCRKGSRRKRHRPRRPG